MNQRSSPGARSYTSRTHSGSSARVPNSYGSQGQSRYNYQSQTQNTSQQAISRSGTFVPNESRPTLNANQRTSMGNPNAFGQGYQGAGSGGSGNSSSRSTPTLRNPDRPFQATSRGGFSGSQLIGGAGAGAVIGGAIAALNGGDPIQGAINGAAGVGGSLAGQAVLTGLAVSLGFPVAGVGALAIVGAIGGGYLASMGANALYNAFRGDDGSDIPDNSNSLTESNLIPGQAGLVAGRRYRVFVTGVDIRDGSSHTTAVRTNLYGPITQVFRDGFSGRTDDYRVEAHAFNGSGTPVIETFGVFAGENWAREPKPIFVITPFDGTSVETDIAQGTQPNVINQTYVTNNVTYNNNYSRRPTAVPQNQRPVDISPPAGLENRTQTIPPAVGGLTRQDPTRDTSKANQQPPPQTYELENGDEIVVEQTPTGIQVRSETEKPVNMQDPGVKRAVIDYAEKLEGGGLRYYKPRGETRIIDGKAITTSIDGAGNITVTAKDRFGRDTSIDQATLNEVTAAFRRTTSNPQAPVTFNGVSTGITTETTVEGESLESDNTPRSISWQSLIEQEPEPQPIDPSNNTSTTNGNAVTNVVEQETEQATDLTNAVVNPPVETPAPAEPAPDTENVNQENFDELLKKQDDITKMLAIGAGATWLASQFAGINTNIQNQPQSPCQWPSDRNTVIQNGQTANTTLGVITNTQLVQVNTTVNANNTLLNTVNQSVTAVATNVTNVANTIGTATSTATNTVFGFLKSFSKSLYLDKIYNAMGLILQIHNAAMLSRNLGESLSTLLDNGLNILGLKDEEGEPLNIGATLSNAASNVVKSIIGESTYNGINAAWKKLSAIYTAAVNIYELLLNNLAGIAEGLEIIGNYTGKIGNALKRGGVVLENAYQWMDENLRVKTGKLAVIDRISEGLENATEVTDNLTEVTEVVIETSETFNQINSELDEVKEKIAEAEEDRAEAEEESKAVSNSPDIEDRDLITPEED